MHIFAIYFLQNRTNLQFDSKYAPKVQYDLLFTFLTNLPCTVSGDLGIAVREQCISALQS